MNIDVKSTEILPPKNQLQLFGYEDYFDSFIKLSFMIIIFPSFLYIFFNII